MLISSLSRFIVAITLLVEQGQIHGLFGAVEHLAHLDFQQRRVSSKVVKKYHWV